MQRERERWRDRQRVDVSRISHEKAHTKPNTYRIYT